MVGGRGPGEKQDVGAQGGNMSTSRSKSSFSLMEGDGPTHRMSQLLLSSATNMGSKLRSSMSKSDSVGGLKKAKSVDLGDGVELTEEMIAEFKECFQLFDKSGDGSVSASEIGEVMLQLGVDLTQRKLEEMVAEVDTDGSGELEFPEFIQLMARQMREGTEDKEFREAFVMLSEGEAQFRMQREHLLLGAFHRERGSSTACPIKIPLCVNVVLPYRQGRRLCR